MRFIKLIVAICVLFISTQTVHAQAPDLVIFKDDGGITADPGDGIVYTISVENLGNQDATGVVVSETVPENTTFSGIASDPAWTCFGTAAGSPCSLALGTVAGGATPLAVDFAVVIDSSVPAGVTQIENTTSVAGDSPELDTSNNTASDQTPLNVTGTSPNLAITKDDGGITTEPGDEVVYTLTVENLGNQDATGVQVTETVPEHTTFSSSNDPDWTCLGTGAGSTCTFDLGTVAAGAAPRPLGFVVLVNSTVPAGVTEIENTTSVIGDSPELDTSDNTASDQTPLNATGTGPDLAIVKDDGDITVDPGDEVVYTLTVQNLGNQDATGVQVTETVPEHTSFSASSNPAWVCLGTGAGSTCTLDLGTVAAGGTPSTIDFAVLIDATVPAGVGEIDNTTSVTDDGASGPDLDPSDNSSSDQTPLSATGTGPDLSVTKDDGGITAEPGDEIVYTLTVENLGNQDATGVQVSETVPEHTTFSPSSDPAWICLGTGTGSTCNLDLGTVAAGDAPQTIDFAVLIDATVPAGVGEIANTTSVTDDGASGPDLDPTDNIAADQTPLSATGTGPDLGVNKDDGGITAEPGDEIVYTLTVENLGNQDATGVQVSEIVPDHTTLSPSSDSAWICLGTGAGSTCTLDLGTVAAGDAPSTIDFAVLIDATVPAGVGEIDNTTSVTDDGASGPDLDPTNNTAADQTPLSATGTGPDLVIAKDDGGFTAEPGDEILYTITVENLGNQDASGVQVMETVPDHTTFSSASDPGWICLGTGAGSTCTLDLGTIAAGGAPSSFAFAVVIDATVPSGATEIDNAVSVTDDGSSGPDLDP
ncbi:MAG: DUF11 domain-containing protein, partial [Actinomycetia bacterium]|nr:DUF11 domain-containing protein [Actinomycetes bacterium]